LANTISAGSFPYPSQKIFPNDTTEVPWSALDFGPLWIPKKGVTIELNTLSILLYSRYILYESPHLSLTQNGIITNGGNELTEYTFTKNYYFAYGDNLAFSTDSRHWGLVSESHLISKANRIIFPTYKPFSNIKRVLKLIE
jgi:signal peptidase I